MKSCDICGAPYEGPVRKFNGGNPIEVMLPACDCEADRLFEEWEKRHQRSTAWRREP